MRKCVLPCLVVGVAAAMLVGVAAASSARPVKAVTALSCQWTITGAWHVRQGAYTMVWQLTQEGTKLRGTATLAQYALAGLAKPTGAVDGSLTSDQLDLTIQWTRRDGTFQYGRYQGKLEPSGQGSAAITNGTGYDRKYPTRQASWNGHGPATCASWPPLPDALIDIEEVSNGCGPGEPSQSPSRLDTTSFVEQTVRYTVDFREACNLHDAGYSGAKVRDRINGGIVDFFTKTKEQVDDKFEKDMHKLCNSQVSAEATQRQIPEDEKQAVIRRCKTISANVYHELVSLLGKAAWEDRPDLRGLWVGPPNVDWVLGQSGRTVKATWQNSGTGLRGQFRGTLISYHHKSIVEGVARITEAGKTAQDDMTIYFYPTHPKQLKVEGPSITGTITIAHQ